MGNPTAFMHLPRQLPKRRPADRRIYDYNEIYLDFPEGTLREQASRCMDCGIPFCHSACPLGNLIPDWNDLVYRGYWRDAISRLHATNNFPDFTGRLCPAPCEGSCTLGINADPVTIKQVEYTIIETAWGNGLVTPMRPATRTGKKVAVVGSGPSGLAAAQQLNRAGHWVTVFERADRIGGLLRYGIPEFKMEKKFLDRRLNQLKQEGVIFRTNANIGVNVPVDELRDGFDAVVLTIGSTKPRDLRVPGRELDGIHFAMEYLPLQNRVCEGDRIQSEKFISAKGKRVVVIGGGDTGADCVGTAHRQGASAVVNLELLPMPPKGRAPDNPWPQWPNIFRTSSAHEEGGVREYAISTRRFLEQDGKVFGLEAVRVEWTKDAQGRWQMTEIPRTEATIDADLVLLALGFLGPEPDGVVAQLGVKVNERGNLATDGNKMTSLPGVFAAGDAARGQSLVVWAIAEGRQVARAVDQYLMGSTELP